MKRSEINYIIKEEIKFFEMQRFYLPKFAYWKIEDWKTIQKHVGLNRIAEVAREIRNLDDRSMYFIANLTDTPIEEFLCYRLKPSISQYWNF